MGCILRLRARGCLAALPLQHDQRQLHRKQVSQAQRRTQRGDVHVLHFRAHQLALQEDSTLLDTRQEMPRAAAA